MGRMPRHGNVLSSLRPYPHRNSTLDADMTPADIVDTLNRLHFTSSTLITIRLDRDVRDFLVAAVTRQGERSR
jgi:hypothetical protein